jgi:hypothetical protein
MTGCAGLTTYNKYLLQDSSYAMDVKQRVVLSKDRTTNHVTCAEPSPDALTVISASAGADLAARLSRAASDTSESASAGGSVGAALAEQGAYIGLRTQSIQLLRDTMYRLCEAYASGGVTPEQYAVMLRRYQSTMMGLLAIEQLSRPVVAAQVALASNSLATAGGATSRTAEQVSSAKTYLEAKVKEQTNAEVAQKTANDQYENAKAATLANLKSAQEAQRDAEAAEKEPGKKAAVGKAAFDKVLDPKLAEKEQNLQTTLAGENIKLKAAQQAVREARTDLLDATTKASAAAGGDTRIAEVRDASAAMTATLASEIKAIVKDINYGYLLDGCFNAVTQAPRAPSAAEQQKGVGQVDTLSAIELCKAILPVAIEDRKPRPRGDDEQAKPPGSAASSPTVSEALENIRRRQPSQPK